MGILVDKMLVTSHSSCFSLFCFVGMVCGFKFFFINLILWRLTVDRVSGFNYFKFFFELLAFVVVGDFCTILEYNIFGLGFYSLVSLGMVGFFCISTPYDFPFFSLDFTCLCIWQVIFMAVHSIAPLHSSSWCLRSFVYVMPVLLAFVAS